MINANKKRLRRTMMFLNAQKPGLIKDPYIYKPDSIMLDLEDAVDLAVNECIEQGILAEFLRKHRAEAMEMGAAAVMANTAIATAGDVPAMANAFKLAIEAGRKAYLTGMGRVLARGGSASDPLTGFLR